jgi:hypothetical protein
MNEIINDYIYQTSCKIIVNKLQKVLKYIICQQMDEMPHWNMCGNLMWRLVTKKLHIVACELHHMYDIVYDIGCPLQLLELVQQHSRLYKYQELQVSVATRNPDYKPNCKTFYFLIVYGINHFLCLIFFFDKDSISENFQLDF